MEGSRLFTADQFQIRFFCLGFPWATFTEKSCKCSSQAERERLIHIAATQSGGFLVNKLRAVNLQLSKYKLIDGGSVSVTQKQVWVLTLMTGTVPTVSTGQDLRTKAPARRKKTLFKPAVQAPVTSGYLCKMSLFCV